MPRIIEEKTFLYIFLKDWVPALITTLIGGGIIALLVPQFQASFEKSRALESQRLAIAESTVKNFTSYIISWQRLIKIGEHERARGKLTKEETTRQDGYLKARDGARILLFIDLETAAFYYFKTLRVKTVIKDFEAWDKNQITKSLSELPAISEWENWKDKILEAMESEVKS